MRDDLGPAALAILQHELTHRFVAYHFPNAPIWLNEGMAEFWATLEIKGGTAYFGSPLQSSVRPTGLSQLLDMSATDFDVDDPTELTPTRRGSEAGDARRAPRLLVLAERGSWPEARPAYGTALTLAGEHLDSGQIASLRELEKSLSQHDAVNQVDVSPKSESGRPLARPSRFIATN